jgi:hypothetical protein
MAWHSYRSLEDDLIQILQYVSLDQKNRGTWSEKIAQQLQLTVNTVGSVFYEMRKSKSLADEPTIIELNTQDEPSIRDFRNAFEPIYKLSNAQLKSHYGLTYYGEITPFKSFSEESSSPQWWQEQNVVKHHFYEEMEKATLDNLVNALGGLFILNILHMDARPYLFDIGVISMNYFPPKHPNGPMYLSESFIGIKPLGSLHADATSRIFEHTFREDRIGRRQVLKAPDL